MITGLRRIAALLACAFALLLGVSAASASSTPEAGMKIHGGPAVWQVSDKDTTIYLFGTIHFLPQDVQWLDDDLRHTLQSSDELVTELDPTKDGDLSGLMAEKGYLPAGENLRDKLAPADRMAFEALLVSLGIPIEQFDRYKPWTAGLYLSVLMTKLSGFDPDQGVEQVVEDTVPDGIRRSALETVQFQIELFNGLSADEQLTYLNQIVASAPTLKQDLSSMLEQWRAGNAKGLAALINSEESDPAIYKHILTDRNAMWAKWIKARMAQPGTVFIAVGAGHLAGKGSVQDQLRKLGLKTKRVH
ncbi:MAG: TraB/GumN family protein [Candidatus Andeanibacterium colombiense]|uniref:TraB/GumN family protein n=1 Tax=Candidatus Andeanibacterium colombiense TaxID=3121345 RepID=A0AAJ5X738_9SPHN|nr:MAG: TraB/GumN family protein [Sphingomonadaceae bacterium]